MGVYWEGFLFFFSGKERIKNEQALLRYILYEFGFGIVLRLSEFFWFALLLCVLDLSFSVLRHMCDNVICACTLLLSLNRLLFSFQKPTPLKMLTLPTLDSIFIEIGVIILLLLFAFKYSNKKKWYKFLIQWGLLIEERFVFLYVCILFGNGFQCDFGLLSFRSDLMVRLLALSKVAMESNTFTCTEGAVER